MPHEPEPTRNPRLKPAATNPWYVLMTVAGEQTGQDLNVTDQHRGHDTDLHARNRRLWNAWMAQALSEEEKARLIAEGRASQDDLAPLIGAERAEIGKALAERCPAARHLNPVERLDLSDTAVTTLFSAAGFLFPQDVEFRSATFSGDAYFENATFFGSTCFSDASFSGHALFENAIFFGARALFSGVTFAGDAFFRGATFSGDTVFSSANFSGPADFRDATLSGEDTSFDSAAFCNAAFFRRTTISGRVSFGSARFFRNVYFSNATFASSTRFRAVRFQREPPEFFDARLHEDTNVTDVDWPDPPGDADRRNAAAVPSPTAAHTSGSSC